jgi:hypothetical protein
LKVSRCRLHLQGKRISQAWEQHETAANKQAFYLLRVLLFHEYKWNVQLEVDWLTGKVMLSLYKPRKSLGLWAEWLIDASKVVSLRTGRFLPPGKFLVLISVRGWIDPRAMVPQPTTLPRATDWLVHKLFNNVISTAEVK